MVALPLPCLRTLRRRPITGSVLVVCIMWSLGQDQKNSKEIHRHPQTIWNPHSILGGCGCLWREIIFQSQSVMCSTKMELYGCGTFLVCDGVKHPIELMWYAWVRQLTSFLSILLRHH